MVPTMPEMVITRAPASSAAIFSFCSLARFCCGRIIRKYMAAAITTMNRMLSTEKVLTFAWLSATAGSADLVA